jgi:hypothetical protein
VCQRKGRPWTDGHGGERPHLKPLNHAQAHGERAPNPRRAAHPDVPAHAAREVSADLRFGTVSVHADFEELVAAIARYEHDVIV